MAPHLESLPTEILNSCFTHLIPPRVPTEATPRTLKQVTFDIHTGYNGKRRALRSLCLTSRRLNAIARACLYRNLGVITGKQIVLLLRSLWNNFELRNLPRSFACPTLLTEDELVISTANHYSLVHKELHRDLDDPVNHGILPENLLPSVDQILPSLSDPTSATRIIIRRRNLPHRGLPQELVARILDRLYRVEDVLVQFPRHRKPEYSIRIPYDPKYTLFELRSWFGRIWSARAGHGPYPTIKSFRIQQAVLPVCFMRTGMDHLDGPFVSYFEFLWICSKVTSALTLSTLGIGWHMKCNTWATKKMSLTYDIVVENTLWCGGFWVRRWWWFLEELAW